MGMGGSREPNYRSFPSPSRRPLRCTMTTSEPWAGGDAPPHLSCNSATNAVLSAEIDSLTVLKDAIEATPVRAVIEPVIDILTLVRVRFLTLFPFFHPFISGMIRTN